MTTAGRGKCGVCVAALLALVSCAHDPRVIAPGDVRELCFHATTGDTVVYRFEGTGPLAFNLHYHDKDEIYYPVPEHETAAEKGQFLVTADQTYCLMWTNNTADRITVESSLSGARDVQFH